jgi:hypothetical protein
MAMIPAAATRESVRVDLPACGTKSFSVYTNQDMTLYVPDYGKPRCVKMFEIMSNCFSMFLSVKSSLEYP